MHPCSSLPRVALGSGLELWDMINSPLQWYRRGGEEKRRRGESKRSMGYVGITCSHSLRLSCVSGRPIELTTTLMKTETELVAVLAVQAAGEGGGGQMHRRCQSCDLNVQLR